MSDLPDIRTAVPGLEELRHRWGWLVALGIILILLGMMALSAQVLATFSVVLFFGVLFLVAGGVQVAHAAWSWGWRGFVLHLLTGILYMVLGLMMVTHPAPTAAVLTLLLSAFYMVGGMFRIITALAIRFGSWLWLLLSGVITLALGILIWSQWPLDSLWVIGLFVGIDLIFNGWSWVMIGLAARSGPPIAPPAP